MDEIGLVSRANAIRVAAMVGRVVAAEGVVADIGVAASTAGEQRTRRTRSTPSPRTFRNATARSSTSLRTRRFASVSPPGSAAATSTRFTRP